MRELVGGPGEFELLEENIGHFLVVMLAGVNENLFAAGGCSQQARHDGGLDELRPNADDGDDFHGLAFVWCEARKYSPRRTYHAPEN